MNNQDITKLLRPLLPIIKVGEVESTYSVRMTPLGKYDLPQLKAFFETFDDYVMCRESSKKGKEHYHAIIFSKYEEDDVREKIRGFIQVYFTDPPKRGDANKQYNLSTVVDLPMAITYLLKDGGDVFHSENINMKCVEDLKKQSYKKYSKDEFAASLEELKKEFKASKTKDLGDMMTKVVQLKGLYRQPVNLNYIYQMCVGFDVHNNPEAAEGYVRSFLSRYS